MITGGRPGAVQHAVEHALLVAELARGGLVAAGEDGHRVARLAQPLGEPADDRRLAGAAGGDVADADDRPRQPGGPAEARVERRVAERRRRRVRHRRRRECRAHGGRAGAARRRRSSPRLA
jgi:hypothetical protein